PPSPPGYGAQPGPARPAPQPGGGAPPPPPREGGRLASALVGGIVGAVVAALVAAGLVLATDDDPAPTTAASTSVPSRAPGASLDIQALLEQAQPTVVSINITQDGQQV